MASPHDDVIVVDVDNSLQKLFHSLFESNEVISSSPKSAIVESKKPKPGEDNCGFWIINWFWKSGDKMSFNWNSFALIEFVNELFRCHKDITPKS